MKKQLLFFSILLFIVIQPAFALSCTEGFNPTYVTDEFVTGTCEPDPNYIGFNLFHTNMQIIILFLISSVGLSYIVFKKYSDNKR